MHVAASLFSEGYFVLVRGSEPGAQYLKFIVFSFKVKNQFNLDVGVICKALINLAKDGFLKII